MATSSTKPNGKPTGNSASKSNGNPGGNPGGNPSGGPAHYDAVIIGAGFAGMYALYKLRENGFNVRVFERGDGVGGTWYWNRYPGARCDVESMEYSYSFSKELQQEWDWQEKYGTQPELLKYANYVADRFDLRPQISFETEIKTAHFDDETRLWTFTTDTGLTVTASACVLATGNLSTPQLPDIKGVRDFAGRYSHTGAWPKDGVDFTGKRVGIIGTGSTAIQAIPVIAEQADHLYVFQRTANFSVPARHGVLDPDVRNDHKARYDEIRAFADTTPFGIAKFPAPTQSAFDVSAEERERRYEAAWQVGAQTLMFCFNDLLTNEKANETAAEFVRNKIRGIVDDPEVAELLCPDDHPIGTRRVCLDSDYYETYNRDNVTLVNVRTPPIDHIEAGGVVVGDRLYELDDLVLATGFDAVTGAANSIDIRNAKGVALKDVWKGGPQTYLGLMTAGFPNMFTITGPQSPSVKAQMILAIEQHVDMIALILGRMRAAGARSVAPDDKAQDAWIAHHMEIANATLYPKAKSWYMGSNTDGKPHVLLPYVGGYHRYKKTCETIVADDYEGFIFEQ